jgi:type IV pilus assembly protein PilV
VSVRPGPVGGFTLIEVLVAVFVLAVGVLGAVAAQTAALRTRQGSALLSDGVQLAAGLADRMRANSVQMQAPDGANPYLRLRYDAAEGRPAPAPLACHAGAGCSSLELAAFDLAEVRQAVYAGFPGGRISVCRDGGGWDAQAGALSWQCAGGAGAPVVIKLGWRRGDAAATVPLVAVMLPGAAP